MYRFGKTILHIMFTLFGGGVRAHHKERLPSNQKGYVIICTHETWLDIISLGIAVYPTPIHFMAKKELFRLKPIQKLLASLNAFPVDRDNPGPSSLKIPQRLIKQGNVVGLFPSGTRQTENLGLKRGAVVIAKRAGVPVAPAVYHGPLTFKDFIMRKKMHINFGEAVYLDEVEGKEGIEEVLRGIQGSFQTLKEEINRS